jgi:NTE family protein
MPRCPYPSWLPLLLILIVASPAAGQQAPESSPAAKLDPNSATSTSAPADRPKIGLALEGGGALGLAHIGVLQWFEDHQIPIDYIAGTSMGGLVGGLYATGKSPEQLRELVEQQNWDIIIGGRTPYQDLSFRRKEDLRAYPNSLLVGLKNGLTLPAGLNAGQGISLLIDHETLPYARLSSFDQLPIPFRCVATDLVSGKEVVFQDGSLAKAMRATMSIPGLFSPVRDGEKVYVDGGLIGNLPTDAARKMGADIVIAVHLETAPIKPEDIQSLFSVLGRSVDVVIRENEIRGLSGADLIVNVNLRDFTSLDYPKSKTIIDKGESATEEKMRILLPYALNDADWQRYLQARDARKQSLLPVPHFVRVEGTSPEERKQLEHSLKPLADKPIDPQLLGRILNRLTGIGRYDSSDYQLGEENGQTGLIITVHEKDYAPPGLQFGFEMDGSESDNVNFTLASRLTFMDIGGFRSEWRTDVLFGSTYGVASELYRPFTASSKWFFAPRADAGDTAFYVYRKSDPLSDYRVDRANIGADLGYEFGRFAEVRAGYEVGYLDVRLRLGTPQFSSVGGRTGDFKFHLLVDHTDDPVFPRRGFGAETTFRWFESSPGATERFPTMQLNLRYFQPITQPASLFVAAEGGSTFGYQNTGIPQFFLGGPLRLSAYGTNELFGNQYYTFRIGYLQEIASLPPFLGKKLYAVGEYEFGKMYRFEDESKFPNDVAAGVIAQTAFGPFFIGGSVGDSGHRKWFFQLGRVF